MTSTPDSKPTYVHQRMVGWYNPPQLIRTGALVVVSEQFALHADNREMQALATPPGPPKCYCDQGSKDFWMDFVADCGDGWKSTYAVACEVAKDNVPLTLPGGEEVEAKRGKLLIFGGDLIYPTPSGRGYDDRLLGPYFDAFGTGNGSHCPDVWALPGNHDWYDSVSAFRRLFCTEQDFGPWKSTQRFSYFATKLPHGWWLFGIDLQLLHEIDQRQLEYFETILKGVGPQDRIILCSPEPYWLDHVPQAVGSSKFVKSLRKVLLEKIGSRLRLEIAGDLHHYQRLSHPVSDSHRITCGTGGAFLHPTHVVNEKPSDGYILEKSYPDKVLSRKLTRWNMVFLTTNPWFGSLPAIFYLLVAWTTGINIGEQFGEVKLRELGRIGLSEFWDAIQVGIHSAMLSPIGVAVYAIIFAGFIIFTQSKSTKFRWGAGLLHSLSHAIVGFLIFWSATYFTITWVGLVPKSICQYVLSGLLIFCAAWIGGSIVMGLYLWISLNRCSEHVTEAFSALRIEDWKGFLRMRICPDGELDVYFIGIERVPRSWRELESGSPRWISNDMRATPAKLEDYVKINRQPAARVDVEVETGEGGVVADGHGGRLLRT
jgi:hypothetical protein